MRSRREPLPCRYAAINRCMSPDSRIYTRFFDLGLTTSRRHFSTYWLGSAGNYLCLRGERGPSADVLIELFQRLWREGRLPLAFHVGWSILWMTQEARR